MSEKKLTQEELLEQFEIFRDFGGALERQAFTQLKEIVEWFFSEEIPGILHDRDGFQLVKEENYHLGLKHGMKSQQKPTVTRTEIENAVGDTSDEYTEGVVELFESKGFEIHR